MEAMQVREAEARLREWISKVLQPHFGIKLTPDDLYPFIDENFCLLLPPGVDGIFVVVSLEGTC